MLITFSLFARKDFLATAVLFCRIQDTAIYFMGDESFLPLSCVATQILLLLYGAQLLVTVPSEPSQCLESVDSKMIPGYLVVPKVACFYPSSKPDEKLQSAFV